MSLNKIINISIILFLIVSTFFIHIGLSSFANIIGDSELFQDEIFEYTVVYFIYMAVGLVVFRLVLFLFLLSPIQKIENYFMHLKQMNYELRQRDIPFVAQEFKTIVEFVEAQEIELREISMAFEKSVQVSTKELSISNEIIQREKELAHKVIEKLSDIVFVVRAGSLVHANNNFYSKFKSLDSFFKYISEENFIHELKNLELEREYFQVNSQIYSVSVEPFNQEYHIVTLIDMTQYNENIKHAQDQNPLTKLPGNESIKKYMYALLKSKEPAVIVYFDFDNFKPFNDKYGFEMGDKMINDFATLLKGKEHSYNLFNAHIGGDDFFCSIKEPFDTSISMVKDIILNFTLNARNLYSREDIKNDYVILKDREGVVKRFPLLSVSAVVVNIAPKSNTVNYLELTKIIASMKKVSKSSENKLAVVSVL